MKKNLKINTEKYLCSFCGTRNVKLWRPYMESFPLICAKCAEERQSPRKYKEKIWSEVAKGCFSGKFTGRKLPLPNWEVNEKGKIPTDIGPLPKGTSLDMTDKLLVDISTTFSSGSTSMIPACPDEFGFFWWYTCIPKETRKWWEKLPTR